MQPVAYTLLPSPLGTILVAADDAGLRVVSFQDGHRPTRPESFWCRDPEVFGDCREQLAAYFAGELEEFHLALAPQGTAFQVRVWRELAAIAYGEVRSYGEVARALGRPQAARAVGAAVGQNPLAIVIPCHRVVGEDGDLTGYRGGLRIKEHLLRLEGARP
jgi:methylated-DNA-[protein]-cysteine S-methyltransferase